MRQDNVQTGHMVYLALGSNLGDKQKNLATALQKLGTAVTIHAISSVYETDPVGYLDQPSFLNQACSGTTLLSPQQLLTFAKSIETDLGRESTFRNAPRPIDIDILLYDDLHIAQEQLHIPHPRMSERAFVLAPLAEIAPLIIDPLSKKTIQALLENVSQRGVKKCERG